MSQICGDSQHAPEYPWVNEEIKSKQNKTKKQFETNENGNSTYQSLWDASKTVLRGKKFIVINAYLKNKKKMSTT